MQVLGALAPVEPGDVGQKLDLRRGPVAVGAVDLAVEVAGVDEEHLIGAGGLALAPVEEPEGAGQSHGVEKVGADGHHHIHGAGFDDLLADVQFRAAGVGGGVGHDEPGAAGVSEGAVEELNPEVVGVVGAGQAEGKARVVLEPVLVHPVHVEGRIGHDEIELAGGAVQVFVVGVALADVAGQTVHGEVHLAQAHGLGHLLLAVDAQLGAGILFVFRRQSGRSARTCRRSRRPGRRCGRGTVR